MSHAQTSGPRSRARGFDVCKLKWPRCQNGQEKVVALEPCLTNSRNLCSEHLPSPTGTPLGTLELLSGALPMPINCRRRYRLQSSRTDSRWTLDYLTTQSRYHGIKTPYVTFKMWTKVSCSRLEAHLHL